MTKCMDSVNICDIANVSSRIGNCCHTGRKESKDRSKVQIVRLTPTYIERDIVEFASVQLSD